MKMRFAQRRPLTHIGEYAVFLGLLALIAYPMAGRAQEAGDEGPRIVQNPRKGLWQDRSSPPLLFELEQVFGSEDGPLEGLLASVSRIAVDDAGDVYVLDGKAMRLVAYRADGTYRWQSAGPGRGPGELADPAGMAWDGDRSIFILQGRGSRLDEYTTEGQFVGTHALDLENEDISALAGIIAPDLFVFRSVRYGMIEANVKLVRRGDPWRVVGRILEDQSGGRQVPKWVSTSPHMGLDGSHVAVTNVGKYEISLYDTSGQLRRQIRRDMPDLVPPGVYGDSRGGAIRDFSALHPPYRLPSGHWITCLMWPTDVDDPDKFTRENRMSRRFPQFRHGWDLYDAADRLLYSIEGEGWRPEIGLPMLVDRQGRLYTSVNDPYPQVRRYRVVVDE